MLRYGVGLIGLLLPCAAVAQTPVTLHASYETYAAGLQVAAVDTAFSLGPSSYQMDLGFHTTGMVGWLFRGHQADHADGRWMGERAVPSQFVGTGVWRGINRLADIQYQHGKPLVLQLVPPNSDE